jgi:hypothetical protein
MRDSANFRQIEILLFAEHLTTIKDYTTVSIPYPGQSIPQLPALDSSYLLPQAQMSPKCYLVYLFPFPFS